MTSSSRCLPSRGVRARLSPPCKGVLVVAVAGAFGWTESEVFRSKATATPSLDIRTREIWRVEFPEKTGDRVAAAAAWDDGTIWVTTDAGQVWELNATGTSLRLSHEDTEVVGDHPTTALAKVPGAGMMLLGRHGVMRFRTPSDPGVVVDETVRSTVRGFAAFANGDYVVAYGQWRGQPQVNYAVHRYDSGGRHLDSWHPAFSYPQWADQEWRAVLYMSGGPLAVTAAGELLVSDAVPFRITRYGGGFGDHATEVIEDESIVSSEEIQRALPRVGTYTFDWNHSVFVDQMSDGSILNAVLVSQRSLFGSRREMMWVVISATGEVLVRDKKEYYPVAAAGPDAYLATTRNGDLVKLEVSVEATSQ